LQIPPIGEYAKVCISVLQDCVTNGYESSLRMKRGEVVHMMRFPAFLEIQLNPGMKDVGDRRWAKPTHRAYISMWVPRNTHPQLVSLDISPETLDPPELSGPPIPLVPGFNRVSRKAIKRI
jgi:hypothetical protein